MLSCLYGKSTTSSDAPQTERKMVILAGLRREAYLTLTWNALYNKACSQGLYSRCEKRAEARVIKRANKKR